VCCRGSSEDVGFTGFFAVFFAVRGAFRGTGWRVMSLCCVGVSALSVTLYGNILLNRGVVRV